jgi:hypothetical protein
MVVRCVMWSGVMLWYKRWEVVAGVVSSMGAWCVLYGDGGGACVAVL